VKFSPKIAHGELPRRELSLPALIVPGRIAVEGLIFSSVHAEVRLTVAVQIKLA
jgi:hypothetical protein